MPKRRENAAVETEKGFGTGLRKKLEGRTPDARHGSAEPRNEPHATSEAKPDAELSETEQLWVELEESLAREEQLKRTLEDQARAYEDARELGRRLAEREDALRRRELELAEQLKALEREGARTEPAAGEHGRGYLRRRIEDDAEPIWHVFQEALTATKANGEPDFRTRLMAATTLLAEAYGELAHMSPSEQVAAARDELAGVRAKRAAKPKPR